MIDLGDELAGWGGEEPPPKQRPTPMSDTKRKQRPGGGSTLPLKDLQAGGFNTTPSPPHRMYRQMLKTKDMLEKLTTWPNPVLPPVPTAPWVVVTDDQCGVHTTDTFDIPDGFQPIGTISGDPPHLSSDEDYAAIRKRTDAIVARAIFDDDVTLTVKTWFGDADLTAYLTDDEPRELDS